MKKRKAKPQTKSSKRNPYVSWLKSIKPKIIRSKKLYTRKGKSLFGKSTEIFAMGGHLNDFLHTCRSSISNRRIVHAVQTGYQKSAGIRRVCRHWSKYSSYRDVCRNVRRNDGSSHSRKYYINRSVLHEKANRLQKATKKWFQMAMGKRAANNSTPCNISID